MRILGRDEKTPAEAVAYTHNCAPDLNGSTISTTAWAISPTTSPPLAVDTSSNTTTTASVRLSGGLEGQLYIAKLKITTAAAEILEAAHEVLVVT